MPTYDSTPAPAQDRALQPESGQKSGSSEAKTGGLMPSHAASRAPTPACGRPEDRTFSRRNGVEMTCDGDHAFIRDVDLARIIGLAKPRNIRERIRTLMGNGDIPQQQVLIVVDDGAQVFYVDSMASNTLAFRSNVADPEVIARRMFGVHSLFSEASGNQPVSMSVEKAMAGYQRTLAFISKEKTLAGRQAAVPLLEKYARTAGLPIPDITALVGPDDQPRLPGV